MYLTTMAILIVTTILFFISTDVYSRVIVIFFGIMGVISVVAFKFIDKESTRRTKLLFGPIKEQMDSLKAETKGEYPGVFSFVDMFLKTSLFKYVPLESQQPPIAEYMIFYKDALLAILYVYKPELNSILELHYDDKYYSMPQYMMMYKKALNLILGRTN